MLDQQRTNVFLEEFNFPRSVLAARIVSAGEDGGEEQSGCGEATEGKPWAGHSRYLSHFPGRAMLGS
jgi:hypothetical protein